MSDGNPSGLRAGLLIGALALSGCMVGPNYRAPDLAPAGAFRNAAAQAPPTTAPVEAQWWRAFGDPVLDSLESRALAQNLDIAAAAARVLQARAAAKAAGAALAPAGEADAQAARARQSLDGPDSLAAFIPHYPRTGSLYDITAGASWEIDLFGGLRRESEAARAERSAADAGLAGARLMVAADVADAYLELRGDQRRLALAQRQTQIDAQLADLTRLRFAAGQGSRREMDEATASLEQARAVQAPLRAAVEAQLNRLAVLTGVSPEAARDALAAPGAIPAAPAFEAGSPAGVLRRRPDLIAAERRLAAANAKIGAAIADYYPKIDLQALAGFESTHVRTLFTSPAEELQGAAGLRWRLFDFGRVDAEVADARGKTAEALAIYRQTALRAAEDVENALTLRRERAIEARDLHASEAALTRARQAAQDAYAAGTLSLVEVIVADRALLQTQDQAALADAQTAQASVALVRAMGGAAAGA